MNKFFSEPQLAELQKPLLGEFVSERDGLSYLEGWHVINEANRILGHGNWSGEVVELRHLGDTQEEMGNNKVRYKTAYLARYRVTVRGIEGQQTTYEDVGYGSAMNYKNAVDNHENAAKEAVTDAMKRAFRNLGNQFGNALYDKEQRNVKYAVTLADVTDAFKSLPKDKRPEAKSTIEEILKKHGFSGLNEASKEALEEIADYLAKAA